MYKYKTKLPSNWRKRLVIKSFKDKDDDCFVILIHFSKTPKGFMKHIGEIRIDEKGFVDEVWLTSRMRGRGLGKMLYVLALEQTGTLSTHFYRASTEAQRVWLSLIKTYNYNTDFWKGVLTISDKT